MRPFDSVSAITAWFQLQPGERRPCCVLLDNTSIGMGLQRREINFTPRAGWVLGFPGVVL